jgi:hypothetical protein
MMRFVWRLTIVAGIFVGNSASASEGRFQKEDLVILETVLRCDGGKVSVDVNNHRVSIETTGIDRVAKRGNDAVPSLIRLMEASELSFDTFARCYAACQKILENTKPGGHLYWDGGATVERVGEADFRIYPFGQEDQENFRAEVVKDVRKQLLSDSTPMQGQSQMPASGTAMPNAGGASSCSPLWCVPRCQKRVQR